MEDQFEGKCTKNVRARAVLFLERFHRFPWVLLMLTHFGSAKTCAVSYILAALVAWLFAFPFLLNSRGQNKWGYDGGVV